MKKQNISTIALICILLLSIFNSCIKEEVFAKATVETNQVTSVTEATATCGGIISADGGSDVTARGVCWSTAPTPTIENDTTIAAGDTLAFTSSIKGLSPGTTYYVRAYAVNKGGVAYGLNVTFTTKTFSITTTPIAISLITATSAIGGGNIISDGDSSTLTVIARGVCWNTFPSPTIENSKTSDGVGGGRFISTMDSLIAFTTYYVRAYATNGNGSIYGNEVSFTTLSGVIGLTTTAASLISAYTARSGGNITADGGAPVLSRGVCWSTSSYPTIANSKTTDGSGTGTFISNITGLTPGTTYFIRTYATNCVGTSYGNEVSLSSLNGVVGLTTTAVSSITPYTATSGGSITSDGGSAVLSRGVCWNIFPNPKIENSKTTNSSGSGLFSSIINNLTPFTTYYVRAYATNSVGTSYGNEVSFTTFSGVVLMTTTATSSITAYTATSGGTITSDGGAAVTERGVCWNTSPSPTIASNKTTSGSGIGTFIANISGLVPFTTYYVRAYATNSVGTSYGNEVSFTTLPSSGTVTDIDGNVYNFVAIGSQLWMVENLKTTKYNDGTSIPLVTDGTAWSALSTPGYCFYDNDAANKNIYGALYNWYTVHTNKLAPTGWHVPTDSEWTTLTAYLTNNGYGYGGSGSDIAKSMASTSGWNSYSTVGTVGNDPASNNSSGFAGLPGGSRFPSGPFNGIGGNGNWWSSTEGNTDGAWYRYLNYNYGNVYRFASYVKQYGYSVRCVRDY